MAERYTVSLYVAFGPFSAALAVFYRAKLCDTDGKSGWFRTRFRPVSRSRSAYRGFGPQHRSRRIRSRSHIRRRSRLPCPLVPCRGHIALLPACANWSMCGFRRETVRSRWGDLNPRPNPYEGFALASLSYTGAFQLRLTTAIIVANPTDDPAPRLTPGAGCRGRRSVRGGRTTGPFAGFRR